MVADALKPGLRTALRLHEIGDASPYQLFFAGKGKSGASFGFMQGDLAAGQPIVQRTFRDVLAQAGLAPTRVDDLARRLSVHLIANPLDAEEAAQVNAALLAGRALLDAMDESILAAVYQGLDDCSAAAAQSGRDIMPKALIYMAMWINMTGPPSKLLTWLRGGNPALQRPVPLPAGAVDGPAMEAYLQANHYYIENPGNLPHMLHCAAAGVAALG